MYRLAPTLALLALSAAPLQAAEPHAVEVQVASAQGGAYKVEGAFTVRASDARVWHVLTNYSGLGAFIPTMRSSTLRRTGPHSALVEQATTTRFLAIQRTTRVLLQVEETPYRRIDFTDVSGRDFTLYRGAWRLEQADGTTRVGYSAIAKPRLLPPFVGASLMQDTVTHLLRDLRDEMLRHNP